MRFTLVLFLLLSFVHGGTTDKKIKKTTSQLHSYSKNYAKLNKKMSETAKAILKQKRELLKQEKLLKALKKELSEKELSYRDNTKQLKGMRKTQAKLKEQQDRIEKKLMRVISKSVSLLVVLDEDFSENEESIIEFEILKEMLQKEKKVAKKLSKKYFENAKEVDFLHRHASALENSIAAIDAKRKKLIKLKSENKKALAKLEKDKKAYKRKLKTILARQNTLKKTLARLNIVKIDEKRKAKEEAARKKAFAKKKIDLDENLPKVKKHGSSYQAVKTKKYRGKKTIAPLDRYTITKKYGTYTDPIYGIKIFNESISLKPKSPNAKVKTVFNGKVIYADKTAVLKNIVIVEHKNGLHTIYANLSQISPNIRKGKKIKRGYTIGRVEDELVFEVTQKSYHINPIRLFK